jgi:hypothetical protein
MFLQGPKKAGPRWEVWYRNLMGFAVLPYNSIKMALVAKEVCKGNRFETGLGCDRKELNPFQWKCVKLNLPGTKDYNLLCLMDNKDKGRWHDGMQCVHLC